LTDCYKIFYFAGRYCLLSALIGIVVAVDITHPINCQALFIFIRLTVNAAIGFASINLAIRTMVIWLQNRYITIILLVLILGHWSIIFNGVLITAEWSPTESACVITHMYNVSTAAIYIYSMAFDAFVLALNVYKLLSTGLLLKKATGTDAASKIGRLVFTDGLIYFIIAFLANLLAVVFMLLDLNLFMDIMFRVPAVVISTIVASRAVRRLSKFGKHNFALPETPISRSGNTSHGRHGDGHGATIGLAPGLRTTSVNGAGEVHVKVDKFTHTDGSLGGESPDIESGKSKLIV